MTLSTERPPLLYVEVNDIDVFIGMVEAVSNPCFFRLDKTYGAFISERAFIDFTMRVREAVANYMYSEGCGCCSDHDKHTEDTEVLARLLGVEPFSDNSGFDFSPFRTPRNRDAQKTES